MQVPSCLPLGRLCRPLLQGRREGAGTKVSGSLCSSVGQRTLLRVLWMLGPAPFSPPTFTLLPSPSCVQVYLTISMEPSLESCLPTAGLLCPFPYLLPLERGQSLVMCGGQAPPGSLVREWTDRTAAPQHPPWGTGPRDGHPGEDVLDHDDHNLKRQQPSVFCALLFLLFIPQQL